MAKLTRRGFIGTAAAAGALRGAGSALPNRRCGASSRWCMTRASA
ncbi:twin-arginine translocation signal domain-containing protein [Sulfitobacter albidus]